jgi:Uma2 family endonuclease
MAVTRRAGLEEPLIDPDQRVFLRDVSWKDLEIILAIRGERSAPRITYLEGALELMSPSVSHEGIKKTLARMLEAYASERGLVLEGFGAWTLRSAPDERAVEPDECYILGSSMKVVPDLAIEVIWTSGGIDKLKVYQGLGVGEVWIWKKSVIQVHLLRGGSYERVEASQLLPEIDLGLMARCVDEAETQTDAVRRFLAAARATGA